MSFLRFLATHLLKFAFRVLCQVDYGDSLERVPPRGPLILVANHINFLDIPLLYTTLYPRRVAGLAKRETWKNPIVGFLLDLWGAIPVDRGRADFKAMSDAQRFLDSGGMLAITPEGTRSGDGKLRRGRGGVVAIALHAGAAILPIGHSGLEHFWANAKALRRTKVRVRVGEPFTIALGDEKFGHGLRAEVTDEIMREIAALLPAANRGAYAEPDPEPRRRRYLRPAS